jgi:hypothetical protein
MKFEIHLDVMQVFVIIAFACLRSKWEKVPEGWMRASSLPSMLWRSRASANLEASPSCQATLRRSSRAKAPQGEVGIKCTGTVVPAGIVQGGSFFPSFACQAGDKMCGSFDKLIHEFGPADATDYARTLVWCFVTSFAERLVPDKLKGLAAGE